MIYMLRQYFILAYVIHVAILYQITKFNSANIKFMQWRFGVQPPNLNPANILLSILCIWYLIDA